MSYTITELDQDIVEPVSLEFQKAWSRIDADYSSDDAAIQLMISSAREALESYLNIGLVRRNVQLEWNGCPMELPLSPNGEITSVTGKDGVISTDDYYTYGGSNKTIAVGVSATNADYFYDLTNSRLEVTYRGLDQRNEIYRCIYQTGYEVLPSALKEAIAIQVDNDLKLMGQPSNSGLCSAAKAKAEPYSRNLVL